MFCMNTVAARLLRICFTFAIFAEESAIFAEGSDKATAQRLLDKYSITSVKPKAVLALNKWDVFILLDNSKEMVEVLHKEVDHKIDYQKKFAKVLLEFTTPFDDDGVDVLFSRAHPHFDGRSDGMPDHTFVFSKHEDQLVATYGLKREKDQEFDPIQRNHSFDSVFNMPLHDIHGTSDVGLSLKLAVNTYEDKKLCGSGKDLYVIISTPAPPTAPYEFEESFKKLQSQCRVHVETLILEDREDRQVFQWSNKLMKKFREYDQTMTYQLEKPFVSKGWFWIRKDFGMQDWHMKILLGGIDKSVSEWYFRRIMEIMAVVCSILIAIGIGIGVGCCICRRRRRNQLINQNQANLVNEQPQAFSGRNPEYEMPRQDTRDPRNQFPQHWMQDTGRNMRNPRAEW